MRMRVDFNYMMEEFTGAGRGIAKSALESKRGAAIAAHKAVELKRGKGWLEWMSSPYDQGEVVKEINAMAADIREKNDYFVVLGIGGSALGPSAVQKALNHIHYNDLPKAKRPGPIFYVEDNIDPERMQALLDVIDIKKTVFNVISKSGNTSETMSQFLIVKKLLEDALGADAKDHIICTTSQRSGSLLPIAKKEGYRLLFVPDGVGGRFSELCPVGLLPAAVCGIEIEELLAGAAYMDQLCRVEDMDENPALMSAAMMKIAMEMGRNISVMMPYADSLSLMSDWYAQLWAESLGKLVDNEGKEVRTGQTPVKSLGVTDQHSQVQLYTEGPFDKVLTFLKVDEYRTNYTISEGCEDVPSVSFLGGHTLNELIQAERDATEYALLKLGKMSMTITLPEVNAFTVGQLLYYFQMETAYMGEFLNIDAFNQPGVEEGKNATYALLGRPGYEEKKAELDARPPKKDEYII